MCGRHDERVGRGHPRTVPTGRVEAVRQNGHEEGRRPVGVGPSVVGDTVVPYRSPQVLGPDGRVAPEVEAGDRTYHP